jgi:cyclopropane fatty-acyl-phospholipid synthase-like methyltransferase
MKQMWDDRYKDEKYVYGKDANEFLVRSLHKLTPGRILFPAEGEGRNAVYAASLGWDVVAFDISQEGRKKALKLAEDKGVHIEYHLFNYQEAEYRLESFDAVAMIFAHMSANVRHYVHRIMINYLKPDGHFLLQGFSKAQLGKTSGGPKDETMLFSKEELEDDFYEMSTVNILEKESYLSEGPFHQGNASLIELIGIK